MSRRLSALDRVLTLLVGLALLGGGLVALDWRFRWVWNGYDDVVRLAPAREVEAADWWPWAFAGAGVVLALLGLWWFAAHLRRPRPRDLRLGESDSRGRLVADLPSVSRAVAARFKEMTAVQDASGTTRDLGRHHLVEVRARLDPRSDGTSIAAAARQADADVRAAFPDGAATCRVVLSAPRRRGPRSSPTSARVR